MSLTQGSDVLLLQSRATPGLPPHSAVTLSFDIDVIFEDEHIAAVVKPPGMLMHRGARKGSTHGNTLVAALPHVLAPTLHEDALARPVALHRLDQGTGSLATLSKLFCVSSASVLRSWPLPREARVMRAIPCERGPPARTRR